MSNNFEGHINVGLDIQNVDKGAPGEFLSEGSIDGAGYCVYSSYVGPSILVAVGKDDPLEEPSMASVDVGIIAELVARHILKVRGEGK